MKYSYENARKQCLNICKEYLNGVWSTIDENDIQFTEISTGFVNKAYTCELNDEKQKLNQNFNTPNKVLFRLYGSDLDAAGYKKMCRECNSEIEEALIIEKLSQKKISPRLLAVFDGGRLEEFIEGRTLRPTDMENKSIVKSLAIQFARMHTIEMPLRKRESFLNVAIKCYLCNMHVVRNLNGYQAKHRKDIEKLLNFNLELEGKWIAEKAKQIDSQLVFAHNDTNLNNILLNYQAKGNEEKVLFIDFDCCCYSYRGHDLACFLTFQKYIVTNEDENPVIKIQENFKHKEFKQNFLQDYLNEFISLNGNNNSNNDKLVNTIEHLEKEIAIFELFTLTVILGLAIVAIRNDSDCKFRSVETFMKIYDSYFQLKNELCDKYNFH